ncbi:MAG: hypothetical protein ACYST6_10625 [Planctomycetota bacterium]|jgi:hypothetical protein
MAEEQIEKKQPGKVKRILEWISVAFFVGVAVYFRVPWKVTALLLIFLSACTGLPKPARKWFWAGVAVVILALIIWVFLPEDNQGWRPYTFDDELAALEAKYAVPDGENAAVIYGEVLDREFFDNNIPEFMRGINSPSAFEFWLSEDQPETAAWLQNHQRAMAKLLEATQMRKCQFPIYPEAVGDHDLTAYSPDMRRYAEIVVSHGNNDIAEGRIDEGLEKYSCAVRIGRHLRQQIVPGDLMMGHAVEGVTVRQLQAFIVRGDAAEKHLRTAEKALTEVEHDWNSDLSRIIEYDKLWAKNVLYSRCFEVNPKGKVRLSRALSGYWRSECPEKVPRSTYFQSNLAKAKTVLAWLLMPTTPQARAKIIDKTFEGYRAMTGPDYDWKSEPVPLISLIPYVKYMYLLHPWPDHRLPPFPRMPEESYHYIRDVYLRATATKRGTKLLIALRRHKNKRGEWPESLWDLKALAPPEIFVDATNGGSFVYRLTGDSFTLYSKGKNNVDESGSRKGRADDWLIWPSKRRLKEMDEEQVEEERS